MDAEQDFQLTISACGPLTTFDVAWGLPCLRGRFNKLREFCGGLASVFPITMPVESDFLLLKFRKNLFTRSQADFSLDSCLQCKQAADMRILKQ